MMVTMSLLLLIGAVVLLGLVVAAIVAFVFMLRNSDKD